MSYALKTEGLEKLIKAFREAEKMKTKVGIIGKAPTRSDGMSNAEIGAKHEFGSAGSPQRSWLRLPLTEHLYKNLVQSNAFTKPAISKVIKTGSLKTYFEKIGITAEAVIQQGFLSGGFGSWVDWSPGYQSNTGLILVDTQQLRDSVSSEVTQG